MDIGTAIVTVGAMYFLCPLLTVLFIGGGIVAIAVWAEWK